MFYVVYVVLWFKFKRKTAFYTILVKIISIQNEENMYTKFKMKYNYVVFFSNSKVMLAAKNKLISLFSIHYF